jgi:hypothetical protein
MYLLFSGDIEFLHRTGTGHLHIRFYLLIDAADHVLENILIGEPEIDKKDKGHRKISDNEACHVPCEVPARGVFVVFLKGNDLIKISADKKNGHYAIIDRKLCKRPRKCSNKREAVTIINVTCNMKGGGESRNGDTQDKETGKVHFIQVFGIKKKVGYAQVFAKTSGDHGKQHNPTQQQHMVALKVIEQQLDRKGVSKKWE